ncbi:NinX [Vibrio phage 1.103.O._10N.261.52.F2]|nr:NinX [Vibrio phage 1.103.O._10N.261.52.F2]
MDTNYDEWSDLQVVTEAAKRRGFLVMPEDGSGYSHDYRAKYPSTVWVAKHEFGNQIEPWEQFNCVKCPNDTWPTIVESKIGVMHNCNKEGFWTAVSPKSGSYFDCTDRNPLRAASICFLKLTDATND